MNDEGLLGENSTIDFEKRNGLDIKDRGGEKLQVGFPTTTGQRINIW